MRIVISIMIWIFFCTLVCLPLPAFSGGTKHVANKSMKSSVSIQKFSNGYWSIIGSGTAVRRHSNLYFGFEPRFGIITAEHVLEGRSGLRACSVLDTEDCVMLGSYTKGGHSLPGSGKDWALLRISKLPENTVPAKIRSYTGKVGEQLVLIGHPWRNFLVAEGMIGTITMSEEFPVYGIVSYIAPGSSGGGVFDKQGRLIAIIVALQVQGGALGEPEYQHALCLAVPVQNVVW